jgi:hypothetical protein
VEHVVFFPAPDGTPAFRRFGTVDDAARFVEHLRNVENVSGASVHAMTEVPLAFKAWYRVELPDSAAEAPAAATEDAAGDVPEAIDATDHADEAPTTIAEVLQSYAAADVLPGVSHVELHELNQATGSVTGILVPERDGATVQLAAATSLSEQSLFVSPDPEPERAEAQVLEPAFGSRRERGTGYFVR